MSEKPPIGGNQRTLEELLRAFMARNDHLADLGTNITSLTQEVSRLNRAVGDRPTSSDVSQKRRRAAVAMLLLGVTFAWGVDTHTENCSPGAQSFAIIENIAKPGADRVTLAKIRNIIDDQQATPVCDVTFPLHSHDDSNEWPTGWSWVGFGVYTLIGAMLFVWQRGRRRDSH